MMDLRALYRLYLDNPVICTDTRKLTPGCLFFALKGERFDGNRFAEEAADKGAQKVITCRQDLRGDRFFFSPDPLATLQALARFHRQRFTFPVLALGGSNGKTTTKELIKAVIREGYRCHATPGNLNNHIGVPLTLLSTPPDTQFLIVEIGANHLQETAFLCRLVQPTYGLITNNGKDHLEGFGSPENVARANAGLYDYLRRSGGLAFVNGGDASLWRHSHSLQRLPYNLSKSLAWSGPLEGGLRPSFLLHPGGHPVQLQIFGAHNIPNALAACAVGRYFGMSGEAVAKALSQYEPTGYRSAILKWKDAVVVADCYNANPSSLHAALTEFARTAPRPRAAILADMLELGPYAPEEHRQILQSLQKSDGLDEVILCGPEFCRAAQELDLPYPCFENTAELKNWFDTHAWKGYHLLLKGSRKFTLEKLIETP
ncbi:MAG: UDP-N-acetylmuramoyl-tripeptide--D-alanyl-D-alanine ligase [Flavobacteriales bacterium]|nr:UDP-N-acetylmuramoyl-tripeptide--D-alanyl-D-alanine ligase [Flavobacteriales bacterium]MDW8431479.1 UDP-N-acetylmuramoyl-tripeptide--D-alanyl-D-alanine ligase [Flavobacteriales bacterium]